MIRTALMAAFALLAAASAFAGQTAAPDARPNILLVYADDMRADSLGASGNPAAHTPNIDRLAARGTMFRRAYCLGSPHGAVCIPSRAMLHTGRPYFQLDLDEFTGATTLGEALGAQGYTTFATGKWHNGRGAFQRSFQSARNVMFSGMSDHTAVPVCDLEGGEFTATHTASQHSSELFADSAIRFVSAASDTAPFFCYLAFTAPHDPRDPPRPWAHKYYADLPPLPANFRPQHPWDIGMMTVRDEVLAPWPRTPEVIRQQLAEYYALIEHMDHQLGRVLAALDARAAQGGAQRETLIVFAADHGLALGSHGLLGKQSVYEHSLHAPLILAGPGVPADTSTSALVYLNDIYPTLLEAAGVTLDEAARAPLLGASLWPTMRGEADGVRDSLFLSMGNTQRAVTDGRYKLIRFPEIDRMLLFDLASDPNEWFDLSARKEQAARIASLTTLMQEWQRRTGDVAPLVVASPKPAEIDLTGFQRKPDRWQPRWIREKYFGEGQD
ncbi:MAG: sulfatase-like hydrolase/transferase [Planctomycetota bacterium]